jgi:hypothetical protein
MDRTPSVTDNTSAGSPVTTAQRLRTEVRGTVLTLHDTLAETRQLLRTVEALRAESRELIVCETLLSTHTVRDAAKE